MAVSKEGATRLTPRDLSIIVRHFLNDFSFNEGGSWGDGEVYLNPGERVIGEKIVKKLKALGY